eukprot:TRINITY_DN12644_c0_g2_i2.p1 TRINITY_DN12644_c0_g2~~TRINITY_DN12644_c0_g2_i2.p1  ORF type:complete len:300 (+),score=19.66 TRINITY_DN12644_c0_g2_i2:1-900(+)
MSIAPSSSLHQIRAMLARSSSRDCAPADLVKICNASACRGILACNIRARDLAQLRLLNVSTGRALDDEKAWKDCLESELKFVVVDSNLLLSSQRRRLLEMYALLSTCRCALQTSLPLNSELDMANLSWMMCSTSHGGTGEARILIGHFRLDNGSEGPGTVFPLVAEDAASLGLPGGLLRIWIGNRVNMLIVRFSYVVFPEGKVGAEEAGQLAYVDVTSARFEARISGLGDGFRMEYESFSFRMDEEVGVKTHGRLVRALDRSVNPSFLLPVTASKSCRSDPSNSNHSVVAIRISRVNST